MNNKSLFAVVVILLIGIATVVGLGGTQASRGLLPEFAAENHAANTDSAMNVQRAE